MFVVKDTVYTNRPVSFPDGCDIIFKDQLANVPDHHIDYFREKIDYIVEKQESVDEDSTIVDNKSDNE